MAPIALLPAETMASYPGPLVGSVIADLLTSKTFLPSLSKMTYT